MVILSPAVFVQKCKSITNYNFGDEGRRKQRVFPIEVHIGGQISNIGIEEDQALSSGLNNGVLTFFFENVDI